MRGQVWIYKEGSWGSALPGVDKINYSPTDVLYLLPVQQHTSQKTSHLLSLTSLKLKDLLSDFLLISAQVQMANQRAIPPTDHQGHHVVQSYECCILKYSSFSRSHLLQNIPALLSNQTCPCTNRMNILPSRIATVCSVLPCGVLNVNHQIGTQLSNMIQGIPE